MGVYIYFNGGKLSVFSTEKADVDCLPRHEMASTKIREKRSLAMQTRREIAQVAAEWPWRASNSLAQIS
jgi:hypothetical protein